MSGQALDGLTLVVYPIPRSDELAWAWMESCMEKYGTNLYPLDLYFVDSQGDRVEVQSTITVTVTYTGDYQAPAVFDLAKTGAVTEMESHAQGHGCYIYHQSQRLLCAGRDRRGTYACRAG